MAKQEAKAAVPRLRFPEFRKAQEWTVKPFAQLLTIGSGRDYKHLGSGSVPVYGSGGYMLSVDDYLYDGESACIGRKGTINNPIFLTGKFWTVDTLFYTHSFKECLPRFVFLHFQRIDWLKHNEAGGVPSLSKSSIEKIEVAVPHLAEQQKIADCLTSLDEVIAAQGRKVEALKAHKRGLMQQLFPREGETRPRLRFPEFRDAPEWEPTDLGRLAEFRSGGTPSKADPQFWNGDIPWVSAKDMKTLRLGDAADHITSVAVDNGAKLVPPGTLLMLTRGMTLLKDVPICIAGREMSFNQDVKALFPKAKVRSDFLAFLLLANKLRLLNMVDVAGHGTGKLDTDELKSFDLTIPNPKEQKRIADCLSSLDTQIAAEANQFAALKTHKQGLMQQLFPAPNGATA